MNSGFEVHGPNVQLSRANALPSSDSCSMNQAVDLEALSAVFLAIDSSMAFACSVPCQSQGRNALEVICG